MSEDPAAKSDTGRAASTRAGQQDMRPDTAGESDTTRHSTAPSPDPRDEATIDAPSFRAATPSPPPRGMPAQALLPGAKIDDFEIIRMLGRGAFGIVYLARQLSLDREVALKLSPNRGSEGRTMARLEHRNIVQVFSEQVDSETDQRLLCMQLVPGVGLERVIEALKTSGGRSWTGGDLLAAVDRNASLPAVLDPTALREREALAEMDAVEATAWIGAQLAEALDYAHRQGVLHRDIKPANILVSPYGRPLLADFNISSRGTAELNEEETFGGTLAYMAPEHLDAFNPVAGTRHTVLPGAGSTGPEAVTERSDVYSLGIVLHQLLNGSLPFVPLEQNIALPGLLRRMAEQRRQSRPACRAGSPTAAKVLEQTICRCMEPEPADCFPSAGELAEQLEGCRQLDQAERRLPPLKSVPKSLLDRPFLWLLVLLILPPLVASAINIAYNASQIVDRLTPTQQEMFVRLVVGYNLVIYPIALGMFVWALWPVWKTWQALCGTEPVDAERIAAARRQALRLPLWVVGLTALGWLGCGLLFPAVIAWRAGSLPASAAIHFVVSFALSGLIALAYSFCAVQYVVLRALYPRMWRDVRSFPATAQRELAPTAARANSIQVLAGSIPLVAAMLMLLVGGDPARPVFRGMVTALIVLGMFGYQMATRVTRSLSETVAALSRKSE